METNYFSIKVYVRNRAKPLAAIRSYPTNDYNEVYNIVNKELLKSYSSVDIIKIDVWPMSENSTEVKEYINKKS